MTRLTELYGGGTGGSPWLDDLRPRLAGERAAGIAGGTRACGA